MIIDERYRYSPYDIAIYINQEDLKLSEMEKLKIDIWEKRELLIQNKWKKDYRYWNQTIKKYLNQFDGYYGHDIIKINKDFKENGSSYVLNSMTSDSSRVDTYFKQIRLILEYSGKKYVKRKFRTVLYALGYKRRSKDLIIWINFSLEKLNMTCFINKDKCDFTKVDLDDMVTFRLNKH